MNPENYLELDFKDIRTEDGSAGGFALPNRRDFVKQLGGGIIILISLGDLEAAQAPSRQRGGGGGRPGLPSDFNAFLRIGEDGRVTCFTGKIEMGQGIVTSLAQMLAEELETPLSSVDMVMGDTDLCPWDMGTFGSMSTRFFGPPLRAAGAEAKGVLLELAAETLKVPIAQLTAKEGVIVDQKDTQRRVTYGELAKGKKIERHLQTKPAVEDVSKFTVIGKPVLRRDALEKVTGKAKYAGDMREPGMLYAKILRHPEHGAKTKSVDVSAAKALPGIQIVQEGDLVAVLAEAQDLAEAALEKIKAEFEPSPLKVSDKTLHEHLLNVAPGGNAVAQGGDLDEGKKIAAKTFEHTYLNGYVAHAAMETHTALAKIEGDKATVWVSTQNPFSAQREIAGASGFPAEKVRVITPFVGGGFGGKTRNTQAVEAARLAKITGKPVQVCWSREEEFYYDTFRPAAIVKIKSGIDAAGKVTFWEYDGYYAGERGSQQFYAIPHHRTSIHGGGWTGPAGSHPFATGAWRAPGNSDNTFAREVQMDLMAAAAGLDPVEFRLKNLTDRKMIGVLKAAAERFGWKGAKSPSKRGFGVACGIDAGTSVAVILEAAVDVSKGTVQVKRVVCAQDMGVAINPEGAKIQMEGCITMGLGYSLTEEVHFEGGKITDTNFDTYELPKFSWVPAIETIIIDSKEAPQGGGEPAIIVMGAAIANAIYDATGARLFRVPMTAARVKEALAKV